MYKIQVYVPETHLESVKAALFLVGAGRIGNYDACCWQTSGQGQFRPLAGSHAMIGKKNRIETVEEYSLEVVCDDALVNSAVDALLKAHPYEVPAYSVWQVNQ